MAPRLRWVRQLAIMYRPRSGKLQAIPRRYQGLPKRPLLRQNGGFPYAQWSAEPRLDN